ncbi:MAG: response regulator [Phenylobacterium sp.]|nr:response regulator [Phenylobacterium sp.]
MAAGSLLVDPADLLSGILEISLEGILIADEDLTVLAVSVGVEQMFGYDPGDLIGVHVEILIPARYHAAHVGHVAAFQARPEKNLWMHQKRAIFARRRDGSEFPVEASLSKRFRSGRFIYVVMLRDVSERYLAEARLQASERRSAIAIRTANLRVFECDFEEQTFIETGAAEALFDEPPTFQSFTTDPFALIHAADRKGVRRAWRRHKSSGRPFRVECRLARGDGLEVWVLLSAELLKDEAGRPFRITGALQNVTARVQARIELEQALAAAEAASIAKSRFLATMSHETRTPLNGVLGMLQAVLKGPLSAEQRDQVDVANACGQSLLMILNGILDLAEIEAGRVQLEFVEFDLADLLGSVAAAFNPQASAKALEIQVDVERSRGRWRGDPTRVRQIAYNLVSNAVKFTYEGVVSVAAERMAHGVRISVSDTGIGMTKAQQAALFRPFHQADSSTTRRFGGVGVGLATSRRLAQLMGGTLKVETRIGRGSRFVFDAPLEWVQPEPDETAAMAAEELSPPRRLRVLAAEDNPTNQLVLRTLLAQLDIDLVVVPDGLQAVEAWTEDVFDLILMDIQMPEMDGLQATHEIRLREVASQRSRTPIVALTANAMPREVAAYLAGGMDACLVKPINVAELVQVMIQQTTGGEPVSDCAA